MTDRPFRPLRDPLFVLACLAYAIGRVRLRDAFPRSFATAYLNDLLCIPIWTPILIAVMDRLRLRRRGDPPALDEVAFPLIGLALTFEVLLPRMGGLVGTTYADPWDVVWYAVGALVAGLWWRAAYADPVPPRGTSSSSVAGLPRSEHPGDNDGAPP